MAIDRTSAREARLDAQELAEAQAATQLANARQGAKHHHAHRGHYGGCHYSNGHHGKPKTQLRIALKGRPPPQRRRQMRAQLDDDQDDNQFEMQDRDTGDRERPFDPFSQAFQQKGGQDDNAGREGDPRSGAQARTSMFKMAAPSPSTSAMKEAPKKFKYAVGPKRDNQRNTAERLIAMRIPGAASLFGPGKATGAGAITEVLGALSATMLSTVRSGTGFAADAPSLTRVAINASRAALDKLPSSVTSSFTLGDTKTLLKAGVETAWGAYRLGKDASESAGNAMLLLPVRLLNIVKPRLPTALQSALDIQDMKLKSKAI